MKGKLAEHRFHINEEPILTVEENPIKSLGRYYDGFLRDTAQVDQIREATIISLKTIDKTFLPGRLKLLCLQFGLLPCLMWPLSICDIPLSKVDKLEWLVSSLPKSGSASPDALAIQHCIRKESWSYQRPVLWRSSNARK